MTASGVRATAHVQFAHRRPIGSDETEHHDANRVAEAATAALAHDAIAVVLDNFTGIDRGYYFRTGLVARLHNPGVGARVVRHLHATLDADCRIEAIREEDGLRIMVLVTCAGARTLLLPRTVGGAGPSPAHHGNLPIDLATGDTATAPLSGPTLILPKDGRPGRPLASECDNLRLVPPSGRAVTKASQQS